MMQFYVSGDNMETIGLLNLLSGRGGGGGSNNNMLWLLLGGGLN